MNTLNAIALPDLQSDRTPDSARCEARPPVPTEGTLLFADEGASAHFIIPFPRIGWIAVSFNIGHGALQPHRNPVISIPEPIPHIHAVRCEHVGTGANHLTVEHDFTVGVDPVKDQFDML
ncbi:MAG: hypothetical protein BWY82_01253 [Verrucomicrobia bacterium ADurb.Bin474]|nr:MAG: hypothetical protein BWY82_01253 [Verrucomicrobia bacterium ADurb.Bin474]